MFQILFIFFNLLLMTTASCPAGSIQGLNSNECYQFYSMPNDWAAAEEQCSNYNNGHLTSIANIFENSFIHNEIQILNYNAVEVWIGGNFATGSWTWNDKTSFIYKNWASGQPSNSINSCMSFNQASTRWYSRDCNNQLPFVCKFLVSNSLSSTSVNPRLSTSITPSPTGVCPSGYQYFSFTGYCYGHFEDNANWTNSENYCINDGGHLVSIHSSQEDSFITSLFFGGDGDDPWIGLHYVNNQWVYTDGTAFDYEPANSLPNDYATNPCADTHTNAYWNVDCSLLLDRVCKVAPSSSVKPSTITPPTGVCPSGYLYFSGTGYCYSHILQTANWSNSEIYCTNNGGHLASIHNYQEDNFIRTLFDGSYDPWIGLHYVNNQWVYTDGTAYDYTPDNSLPNDYATNPCADMHQAGYFNNVGCNEFSLTSVCKVAPSSNKKI